MYKVEAGVFEDIEEEDEEGNELAELEDELLVRYDPLKPLSDSLRLTSLQDIMKKALSSQIASDICR